MVALGAVIVLSALVLALVARRRRLLGLYRQAQSLHGEIADEIAGPDLNLNPRRRDLEEDYDAVVFSYNVLRELPLSLLATRGWPMLAWSTRVVREARERNHRRWPERRPVV